MIELLLLFSLFQSHSVEKEISYINLSSSTCHKEVLEPDKQYDIVCSSSSSLVIELSKPGTYYIKQLLCSGSSNVIFLKSPWKRVHVNVGLFSLSGSSCINIEKVSKCISVEKKLISGRSCVIRDTIIAKLLYWL